MAGNRNTDRRAPIERRLSRVTLFASIIPSVLAILFLMLTGASVYIVGIVAILLAFLTLFTVSTVWRESQYQFRSLHNILDAVVRGDYSFRGSNANSDSAFGELMGTINSLASSMQRQRLESEESQLLMLKVVDQIDVAIIAWDQDQIIQLINPAARELLGIVPDENDEAKERTLPESLAFANSMEAGATQVENLEFHASQGRFRLHREKFITQGNSNSLLFITNVSSMLRLEEQKAWRNLVRVLSHEINNSLTPLKSFSSTLIRQVEKREQDAQLKDELIEGLSVIGSRAESLKDFVQSYHKIAQLPEPQCDEADIDELMRRLIKLFPDTQFTMSGTEARASLDSSQFEQVVINLIKNAIEASAAEDPVAISWSLDATHLHVQIEDEGEGILNPENLFTPYYTTKKSGSGIGLVFCQQVVEAHGGYLDIGNKNEGSGCLVKLAIPHCMG